MKQLGISGECVSLCPKDSIHQPTIYLTPSSRHTMQVQLIWNLNLSAYCLSDVRCISSKLNTISIQYIFNIETLLPKHLHLYHGDNIQPQRSTLMSCWHHTTPHYCIYIMVTPYNPKDLHWCHVDTIQPHTPAFISWRHHTTPNIYIDVMLTPYNHTLLHLCIGDTIQPQISTLMSCWHHTTTHFCIMSWRHHVHTP